MAMNSSFGHQSAVNERRLALKLSLYVLIHVIQFGAGVVEAAWVVIEEPPIGVRYATVFIGATGDQTPEYFWRRYGKAECKKDYGHNPGKLYSHEIELARER
ncbi:Hypothetical predicted protein [Mytilus galloprovincialis]|uniref:Uncharacterized protein n=1 Tax=Mytilus galloprovincialis TaxID=29158 RepID=A0A8B6GYU4_MYTGA|nr:Hypothetical predicted protein [Mytilus galloprovincialis]